MNDIADTNSKAAALALYRSFFLRGKLSYFRDGFLSADVRRLAANAGSKVAGNRLGTGRPLLQKCLKWWINALQLARTAQSGNVVATELQNSGSKMVTGYGRQIGLKMGAKS